MDKYIKEETDIGHGSYGTVYRALKRDTNETYALKIIDIKKALSQSTHPNNPNKNKENLSDLLRECHVQNKLKHPNIVQMIEYFLTDNGSNLVIVSELATCSLFDFLQKQKTKRLELATVEKYSREITAALHYMHSKCIIHRDLKPQNILIGKNGQAQLCDFGFARNLSNNQFLLQSIKGTPIYFSPELMEQKPYDERTDLWSFGCIVYELLVGIPPFASNSLLELVRKIILEPLIYPSFIDGHCRSFLEGLLEKDQKNRLGWPQLLHHPFVAGCVDETSISHELNSLTITRSPSQEFAKNMDLDLMTKLRELKLEKIEKANAKYHMNVHHPGSIIHPPRHHNHNHNMALGLCFGYVNYNYPLPHTNRRTHAQFLLPRLQQKQNKNNQGTSLQVKLTKIPLSKCEPTDNTTTPDGDTESDTDTETDRVSTGSSCETLSSSSNSNSEDESVVGACSIHNPGEKSKSLELCDSGVFSRIENQKPIESEEWVHFLKRTMKEIVECPTILCDKHFLNVIITPLRNPHSSSEVVENIALLLTLPFSLDPTLCPKMLEFYLEGKVVPNLVSACLLNIQRRKILENSRSFKNLETLLTDEEISSLERCLELISFLMLSDERFIIPFCDSIGILNGYTLLELFIKSWRRKKELALYALNFLTIVLDKDPRKSFVEIIETLFLDKSNGNDIAAVDLWELIENTETDSEVRSKALRLLGLLLVRSAAARAQFMSITNGNGTRLWNLVESLKSNHSDQVIKAATFVGRLISYTGFLPPQISTVQPTAEV